MKAEIVSVDLIDYENWAYWPDDPTNFCVAAEALLRSEGGQGFEIFSFEVCTPRWLVEHGGQNPRFIRHVVLMTEYDEQLIKNLVRDLVEKTTGDTWSEVAEKLSRYMFWEFEDYESYKDGS